MDNPARVAEFRARLKDRRDQLQAEVAGILPPGSRFVLEIGSGHGHFLTAFTQANPDRQCVGIDLQLERVARANRKRDRAKLPNLHFLRGDVAMLLEVLPPGVLADLIFEIGRAHV